MSSAKNLLPQGVKDYLKAMPKEVRADALPTINNISTFRKGWSQFATSALAGNLSSKVEIIEYPAHSLERNPLPMRIYRNKQNSVESSPVILCTAGGGFIANRLETNQTPWSNLAAISEFPVISYQYTTAPESQFNGDKSTQSILDAQAMAQWLFNNATQMGFDDKQIYLIGDSSGANLVIYQTYVLMKAALKPAGVILISPVVDLSRNFNGFGGGSEEFSYFKIDEDVDAILSAPLVEACYKMYAPDPKQWQNPVISPLYLPDLAENFPQALQIIVASCDRLKRDAFALGKLLSCSPTVIPGVHSFLTARALFGEEAGDNPISIAGQTIKEFNRQYPDTI